MRPSLNKHLWLVANKCAAKAWYTLRDESELPTAAAKFRTEQGQEIGRLAWELFPEGMLVKGKGDESPVEETQNLISSGTNRPLFEAAFSYKTFRARADILIPVDNGEWHLLEVKSSSSDTKSISDLVNDLAYTHMVVEATGQKIGKASLVLLSRDYRFGDSPHDLFEIIDKTDDAKRISHEFSALSDSQSNALFDETPPEAKLISECRDCQFFETECLGKDVTNSVLEIPGLHHTKLKKLSDSGIVDLKQLPEDIKLNEIQLRAVESAATGKPIVGSDLRAVLTTIQWPCYYLDFETVSTALPLYEGHRCHQQVLTQYSIHKRESINTELNHVEYLADAKEDSEHDLANHLIEDLSDNGSIIVYSSFEQQRIKALGNRFEDLADPMKAILDRLVDLHPIVKNNVYYPAFKGSLSIKAVLPALVPDLSYKDLNIGDGDSAIAQFARMARGEAKEDEVEQIRKDLLAYCKLDTFAMVRLHEILNGLAE